MVALAQAMLLPEYPFFTPLVDGGLERNHPDPVNVVSQLKLGFPQQLVVLLARHQAGHPPSLVHHRLLRNFKDPLRFGKLLGRHSLGTCACKRRQASCLETGKKIGKVPDRTKEARFFHLQSLRPHIKKTNSGNLLVLLIGIVYHGWRNASAPNER
jgi:hypothetical protein